eukprot:jgi/Mesvir1/28424/Mv15852-RA.2
MEDRAVFSSLPNAVTSDESVRRSASVPNISSTFRGENPRAILPSQQSNLLEKVFGSDESIMCVPPDVSSQSPRCYTTDPLNHWRQLWELLSVFCIVYTICVNPVRAAFYSSLNHDFSWNGWEVVDMIIDALNLLAIPINFFSGYVTVKDDVIERSLRICATRYLKRWFLLDTLTSLPWDLMVEGRRANVYRIVRCCQVAMLTRKLRKCRSGPAGMFVLFIWDTLARLNMSNYITRILYLLTVTAGFIHCDTCFQMIVTVIEDDNPDSWINRQGLEFASVFHQYTWALFMAQSHMIGIGYGFSSPYTEGEVWAIYVSMVLGSAIYILFVSIVCTLLIEMDRSHSAYARTVDQLQQYMRHRKLPFALRKRILTSFDYRWRTRKMMDEMSILGELPPALRVEVCMYTCRDLLRTVPFFEDAEEGFLSSVVTLLQPLVVLEGDTIVREGEVSREMYFLRSGQVQVSAGKKVITQLKSGSYFGEIGLLARSKRTATITAMSPCELYVLYKEDFDDVIIDYPEVELGMRKLAEHRLTALMKQKGTGSMPGSPHTPTTPSKGMLEKLKVIESRMGPTEMTLKNPASPTAAGSLSMATKPDTKRRASL